MKYETYCEIMAALRFRDGEMIDRAAQWACDWKKTPDERERGVENFHDARRKIKAALRELKREEHWERYSRTEYTRWMRIGI